jgi:hypothetical protein
LLRFSALALLRSAISRMQSGLEPRELFLSVTPSHRVIHLLSCLIFQLKRLFLNFIEEPSLLNADAI